MIRPQESATCSAGSRLRAVERSKRERQISRNSNAYSNKMTKLKNQKDHLKLSPLGHKMSQEEVLCKIG